MIFLINNFEFSHFDFYDPEKVAKIERERGDVISPLVPPVKDLKDRIATDAKFNLYFNTKFT